MIKRVKEIVARTGFNNPIEIRKRNPVLRALSGWYSYVRSLPQWGVAYEFLSKEIGFVAANKAAKTGFYNGMKIGKFLVKKNLPEAVVSGWLQQRGQGKFKFSCKFNDLLRMAETKHFTSCFKNTRANQLLHHLYERDVAVIFEPSENGDMKSRCIVRLLNHPEKKGEHVLGLYKMYGDGFTHNDVARALDGKMECYTLLRSFNDTESTELKTGGIYNYTVIVPDWSDAGYQVKLLDNGLYVRIYRGQKLL